LAPANQIVEGVFLPKRLANAMRGVLGKVAERRIPGVARRQARLDRRGAQTFDPGTDAVIEAAIAWLCRAQDCSRSIDGGVARSYSLLSGWATSYPETIGYIIPTFLDYAAAAGSNEARVRAKRMLDWLVSIQLPCGGFQGGKIDSTPVVPVHFNTGQILLGLAAGEASFGGYGQSMRRAADWLVEVQDPDGCWRKFQSPFAVAGEKTYDTHVAWGLLEAARIEPNRGYAESALANVRWALTKQRENGWFDNCCLTDASKPLTHTIGYALRGVLEAYRYCGDTELLRAARRTADGLLKAVRSDGSLPGLLAPDWSSAADWVCLTGMAQIAHCWLVLFQETSEARYRDAAFAANQYVRCTVLIDGPADTRGGVKGSFPIDGAYGRYEYLNWAAKFLIDSLVLERDVRRQAPQAVLA
jgi:hypothetical protein